MKFDVLFKFFSLPLLALASTNITNIECGADHEPAIPLVSACIGSINAWKGFGTLHPGVDLTAQNATSGFTRNANDCTTQWFPSFGRYNASEGSLMMGFGDLLRHCISGSGSDAYVRNNSVADFSPDGPSKAGTLAIYYQHENLNL